MTERLGVLLGLLVASLGAVVMVGWHLHIPRLLQIHPSFVAMTYNTALAFLLSGLAVFAVHRWRPWLTWMLAGAVLLLGGLTLLEIVTGVDVHIDQLLMKQDILVKTSAPGRMAPNTALCYILTAITLLVFTSSLSSKRKALILDILAPSVMALALIALAGYALEAEAAYGWGNLTRMAVHTSAGFVVIGLALLLLRVSGQPHDMLPGIGVALLVLVLTLWQALVTQELASVKHQAKLRADQLRESLRVGFDENTKELRHMAARWEQRGGTPRGEWLDDAKRMATDAGHLLLARMAEDGQGVWIAASADANAAARIGAELPDGVCRMPAAAPRRVIRDLQLGALLLESTPLRTAMHADGCLVTIVSLTQEVSQARTRIGARQYLLTIQAADGAPLLVETGNGRWHAESVLQDKGLEIILKISPTQDQLASSGLPEVVLVSGLVLDVLLLLALRSTRAARRKTAEAQRLQEQMRNDLSLRRQVIDNAPYGIVLASRDGHIELVNAALLRLFGYSDEDLIGQPLEILISPDKRASHVDKFIAYLEKDVAAPMTLNRRVDGQHRDGHAIPLDVTIAAIDRHAQAGAVALVVDISERLTAQRRIEEQIARVEIASEAAGVGFWDFDLVTGTLQWDDMMFRLYGRSRLDGKQPYALWAGSVHPDDLARSEQELGDAINGVRGFDTEFRVVRPDGEVRTLKAVASVVRNAEGKPVKVFGVNIDVSERKQFETRQAELVSQLTRINEELNNFAYIASHDLKSPLRGIDQLATWIAEDMGDDLNNETKDHLRLMRSRIKRMEMLLEDLLAYSRAGRSDGELVDLDTGALVREVFEMNVGDKPIELRVAHDLPVVNTRQVPLALVFRNLIGNAVKHLGKPDGTITVSARHVPGGVEFAVTDDGPGIAPEHQERVFAMFQTLKPRDELEGSGIGLAVVKKTVESVGGKVMLESDGHNGCTFRFTWPARSNKEKSA